MQGLFKIGKLSTSSNSAKFSSSLRSNFSTEMSDPFAAKKGLRKQMKLVISGISKEEKICQSKIVQEKLLNHPAYVESK